jgi:hypothetical protein
MPHGATVARPGRVIACAGRRVDAPGAVPRRFPPEEVGRVALAIRRAISDPPPHLVMSSAACGADLLFLEAALDAGARARVILPFAPEAFRRRSVEDRPGDWGRRFDDVLRHREDIDLVVLSPGTPRTDREADVAYRRVTNAIVDEALRAGATEALIVWDGHPKSSGDETEAFRKRAIASGWRITDVLTTPQ